MITVVQARDHTGRWRLISRTSAGADLLASARTDDDRTCLGSLRRLCAAAGTVDVVLRDGHYQWIMTDAAGRVIAESPAIHRRPDICRAAFTDAQRAARIALGERSAGQGSHRDPARAESRSGHQPAAVVPLEPAGSEAYAAA